MPWYDWFAGFYDASLERLYRQARDEAISALQVGADSVVLDLACGTGQNFPPLFAAGPARVIGVDFSAGMLARARQRAERAGWSERITLIERDARALTAAELDPRPDRLLCTLGLSVIPDWERVLDATLAAVQPGSRVVVMDVFQERWVPQSTVVSWMAQADLHRPIREALEARLHGFQTRALPGSAHVHGGTLWLASGLSPR